jgi:hypothetical protein
MRIRSESILNLEGLGLTGSGSTRQFVHPVSARSRNETSSARLAHLASSKKRLSSARSGLVEPTSLAINVNLRSKL